MITLTTELSTTELADIVSNGIAVFIIGSIFFGAIYSAFFEWPKENFDNFNEGTNFKVPFSLVEKMINEYFNTNKIVKMTEEELIFEINEKSYKIGFKTLEDYKRYCKFINKMNEQIQKSKIEHEKIEMELKKIEDEKKEFKSLKEFSEAIIQDMNQNNDLENHSDETKEGRDETNV